MVQEGRRLAKLAIAAMVLAPALPVHAQLTGADRLGSSVAFELGAARQVYPWSGGGAPTETRAVLFGGPAARIRVIDTNRPGGFILDLDIVWRAIAGASGGESLVHASDPYVGVRFGHRHGNALGRWGLGLTLPFGALGSQPHEAAPLELVVRAANMLWDPWLYSPGTIALVTRGDFSIDEGFITAGVQGALGVLLSIESGAFAGVSCQFGAWIGLRLGPIDIGVFGHEGFALVAPWPYPSSFGPFARLRAGWFAIEARAYTRSPPSVAIPAANPDVSGSVTLIARLP